MSCSDRKCKRKSIRVSFLLEVEAAGQLSHRACGLCTINAWTDLLMLFTRTIMTRRNTVNQAARHFSRWRGVLNTVCPFFFHRVLTELVSKMRDMQMDKTELGCLRAIVLFNPGDILDTHHLLVNLCFFLLTNLIPFSCSLSLSCSTFFSILPFFST